MRLLFVFLALSLSCWATPLYHQQFKVDLDHDGQPEKVALAYYPVGDVKMGQLQVFSSKGKLLWASPKLKETLSESPWSFLGEFDLGDISWVDDYDGDGKVDLCATVQKSDVSPTRFRLYHWNGQAFRYDKTVSLSAATSQANTFEWTAPKDDLSAWGESMKRLGPGLFEINYLEIPKGSRLHKVRFKPGQGFIKAI
ncbi:hypothetical protein JST97_21765 [bacterium]|nr:hypothetical protein [bacterium]